MTRFGIGADEREFARALREMLEREWNAERLREVGGFSPDLWRHLVEMGISSIAVPESAGGLGLDETALMPLLEEVGRAGAALPVGETAAVAAPLLAELAESGSEAASEWLARAVEEGAIIGFGEGKDPVVAFAGEAEAFLLFDGGELHLVPAAQVTVEPAESIDALRPVGRLGWEADPSTRLAGSETAEALVELARDRGAFAASAEMIGVADRLLADAVAYAKEREQFGRPIGSFQAIQHMLADARLEVELMRPVVMAAAKSLAGRRDDRGLAVSLAKARTSESARTVAKIALQVHGAMGYTWELDLHFWLKHALALSSSWGTAESHIAHLRNHLLAATP